MKTIGIVSYNIRCNFTNYGSALQSWALKQSIKKLGYNVKLVDYCPKAHIESDPLNPFKNMWDQDSKSKKMVEEAMPFIQKNYYKFEDFYNNQFDRTKKMYLYENFENITQDEKIDSFVCGADTIFCVDEFGVDEIYYANSKCMKNNSVSYAASFGDLHLDDESRKKINERFHNFKALGIRENNMIDYVKEQVDVPVQKVLDPTLLLESNEYDEIIDDKKQDEKYILLYCRRHNERMIEYADALAKEYNLKIIDISLRQNPNHEMRYDAGVEEFLNLVKNAQYVVTNSFHGMIFSIQFKKDFVVFSREQCDTKIEEVLNLVGLRDRLLVEGNEEFKKEIDYDKVHKILKKERKKSIEFLKNELNILSK